MDDDEIIEKCHNISPVDGRYYKKVKKLANYFSEAGLIYYRCKVEIEYLIYLIKFLRIDITFNNNTQYSFEQKLRNIYTTIDDESIIAIKKIEAETNHDVKAVEIYLRHKLTDYKMEHLLEYIHFGLTSQDVNSTSYVLSMKQASETVILPELTILKLQLIEKCKQWGNIAMITKTHGQPASPSVLGKEMYVFVDRLNKQMNTLINYQYTTKFGGAIGNFNSHQVAFPNYDWIKFGNDFIESMELKRNQFTTQIDIYDNYAELFDNIKRISTILVDFTRDIWIYISNNYLVQKCVKEEVGSSTMPHKINPINFENAEGNLMLAINMLEFLSRKLPISRLQRDLTDSTVLRNIGMVFSYLLIGIKSLQNGLKTIDANRPLFQQDLNNNEIVLAEAVQSILRREGIPNSYNMIKDLSRNNQLFSINFVVEKLQQYECIKNHSNKDKIIKEISDLRVEKYIGVMPAIY